MTCVPARMSTDYPDSHYHRELAPVTRRARFEGPAQTEVCIVGGGLAGLCLACDLAAAGVDVAVLEARRIAWGASGRNGGFVSAGYALGLAALRARLGRDHARRLGAISRRGVHLVRERIARHGARVAAVHGVLTVWRHPGGDEPRVHCELVEELLGQHCETWPRERVRAVLRSERYFEAVHDDEGFHVQPLAYALALADAAAADGARLYESSAALGLRRTQRGWRVLTAAGDMQARHVVLAGSALLGRLEPRLARAVLPVTTYMMTTEPLGERLREAIRTDMAVADTRGAGDYYRVRDGRIVWGGRMTTRLAPPSRLARLLGADLLAVYPQLAGVRVDSAWSGLMGYSRHRMPLIGRLEDGLWYLTAFGGHGLNTSAALAELLARAIASGDDEYRQFAPFAPVWTGGLVGRALAQATYWHYQFGDWLRERGALTRR